MIIPGSNSVKSSNFDVYLALVFKELVQLWRRWELWVYCNLSEGRILPWG
jgi:hypothetical protein